MSKALGNISMWQNIKWKWYQIADSIGGISDVSRKHRAAILFISACVFFIESNVKITIGKASLAGLGVSIEPVQVVPIGPILIVLLAYRTIAFWIIILTEHGVNFQKAKKRAQNSLDPDTDAPRDTVQTEISVIASLSVYRWRLVQVLWEVLLPTALALTAIIMFYHAYFSN